ncbi:MAG: cytochrome c [Candidatus Sumerlaeia bacterium]|nr:cytochrome c [Candidatus Sumerlaeia bacterium]
MKSLPILLRSAFVLTVSVLLFSGCDGRRETREILNMPDMHFSYAYKAQEENPFAKKGPMMLPPEGTVPVNFIPYTISNEQADTLAMALENPLTPTQEVLLTGQKYYNIYCMPCHGAAGDGHGTVVKANVGMPMPPKLYSDKIRNEWTDGRIYHVLTVGQGNMPAYNTKIDPEKRWAIIHYVRALGDAFEKQSTASTSSEPTTNGRS